MSLGQGFGEGSIVEATKGGRFGELTYNTLGCKR